MEPEHTINDMIRARTVRVVGDGVEHGVYTLDEAKKIARDAGLDLVEIASRASAMR